MPIIKVDDYVLSGVTSNFCVKYSADNNFTRSVLARINTRPTKLREPPPVCRNGFVTDRLPFAKGHVIALELGGSDEPYNVAPQFEDWQGKQNGKWRQLEMHIKSEFEGQLMLVEINYGRTGGIQGHANMLEAFRKDRLMDWTDERIPDKFEVRVWDDELDPSKITGEGSFDSLVEALRRKPTKFQCTMNLGVALPEPDRGNYILQTGVDVCEKLFEEKGSKLKRGTSMATFMLMEGTIGEVRGEMEKQPGVTPVEAKGMMLCPLIMAKQQITVSKIKAKRKTRGNEGIKMVSVEEVNRELKKVKYFKKEEKDEEK